MRRSVLLIGFLCFLMAALPAAGRVLAADTYRMTFRGYSAEILRGIEEYIAEFPLYAGHRLIEEGPRGAEYEYRSGAFRSEIVASLRRMFLYLDIEGGIDVEAGRITVTDPHWDTASLLADPAPGPGVVDMEQLESSPESLPGENTETQAALQTPPAPAPAPQPLTLRLTTARGDRPAFSIGEKFDLTVELNRDAWLYCYYRQVDGSVVKFFPNPQHGEAKLKGGVPHRIPGDIYPFDLAFSEPPGEEMLTCFATARDVGEDLPSLLRAPDFGILPAGTDARLHGIFEGLKDTEFTHGSLRIEVTR